MDILWKKFEKIYPLYVEQFEEFSPVDNETITDKMNKVIQSLNRIGRLSESVVKDWNKVFQWLMNEGLSEEVLKQMNKWKDDGTFQSLLDVMFETINEKVDGFQGQLDTHTTQIAEKASYPVLGSESGVTNKTYPYGHLKRYGGKCDFNTTTLAGSDDTSALNTAIQNCINNGFTLRLEGFIKIIDEISIEQYSGLKIVGDSQRKTMIYQATDNKVILRLKGQLYDLQSFGLAYVNPQPIGNTNAIAIATNTCNKSKFDKLFIFNSNQAIGIPSQTGGNFIFSCVFSNITISVYSNIAINLTHQAGSASTGNVFENIYINNQQPGIGGATIGTADTAIKIDWLNEGTFTQINIEWSKLNTGIYMNACNSLSFDSVHIEGVEFLSSSKYVFEFVDSKGIMLRGGNLLTTTINTTLWRLGMFYVQGRCYINVQGFNETGTITNGKQFHRGVCTSVNTTTKVYFMSCYFTTSYTDNGNDNSIFIDEMPRVYKGTTFPSSGLYQLGDICYNTNPISGGYMGWTCIRAGRAGKTRQNSQFYDAGTYIIPATDNGHVYIVVGSGVSGSSIPTYPTTTGATVVDGAISLQESGISSLFKTYGLIS